MVTETLINTYTKLEQDHPSIAALNDGGFVVCWESSSQDGSATGIYAQRYNASGIVQGNEFRVNTTTSNEQDTPSIITLKDGGFLVTWQSEMRHHGGGDIYGQRYDSNGVIQGSEFRINTDTNYSLNVAIAAYNDGGFVVSWSAKDDNFVDAIYAQRYNANGIAQGGEFQVNTTTTSGPVNSSIAALSDGGFVVSWKSKDDSYNGIFAQRYDANGIAQGGEFRVNTTTLYEQANSSIAALSDGGFVISWASQSAYDGGGVYVQRYDANGIAQGGEFLVNTTIADALQVTPSVRALNDGGFVVVWNGDSYRISVQRYDANGIAQGDELLIVTKGSDNPSVAALNDGGFVVSWDSDDGNGQGVFGKRFDVNGHEVKWDGLDSSASVDRLFNWAESLFVDLFPNHPASQEIEGYHARIYSNGNALGEKNDSIYFYDGHTIVLVGTVNDYLATAIEAGF